MELCVGGMETSNLARMGFQHQKHSWEVGWLGTFNLTCGVLLGCEKCAHEVQSQGTPYLSRPGSHGVLEVCVGAEGLETSNLSV